MQEARRDCPRRGGQRVASRRLQIEPAPRTARGLLWRRLLVVVALASAGTALFAQEPPREDAVQPPAAEDTAEEGPQLSNVDSQLSTVDSRDIEPRATSGVPSVAPPVPLTGDLTGRGLLDFRGPFPLAQLHLQLPTAAPPGLRAGRSWAALAFDWANSFGRRDSFLVDAETFRLRLGYWHALRRDIYVGVEAALAARDGGVLDEFIDDFHEVFDIKVVSRATRPQNQYDITVRDRSGRTQELDRGIGLANTTLKAHWIFLEGRKWWPTLSLQGLLSLPTSTRGFGGRSVDLGLALVLQKKVSKHLYLYGVAGGTYLPDSTTAGMRFNEFNAQLSVGFEVVLWWDSVSLVGQYVYYSGLLDDTDHLDEPRQYVGGAIKHRISPDLSLTWGFMENLPPLEITADVAFVMGCEYRF